jgi:tetratricopeptide (TPR) repeat protein
VQFPLIYSLRIGSWIDPTGIIAEPAVNNLGNLYKNQGKLEEAEKMYQRALQGKEKAWGPSIHQH